MLERALIRSCASLSLASHFLLLFPWNIGNGENLAETASVLRELLEAGLCLRLCPDVIYCV